MKEKITVGGYEYLINAGPEEKEKIFRKVIEWMQDPKHGASAYGEGIHQDDDCIIDAPDLISDIVDDILKPKSKED